MNNIYDMLIIGGGPAGYSAALYASRAELNTLVIEKMCAGGQMVLTDTIDNYPGFEDGIDGFSLSEKMKKGAERFGAKTEYTQVTSVDFSDAVKKITTSKGEFFAKTVIIASGAKPRELEIPGERELTGKGVHYCAHCDGRFYKGKTVVVVGGGNSAAADALYLCTLAKKVYVVHRRDALRATKIYHKPLMEKPNIEFIWNSTVSEFLQDGKIVGINVKDVNTHKTQQIKCDGVFISIGRKPETDFLRGCVKLDSNGYIVADENTRTDIPGVYAVGDVRTKPFRQVVTAVSDGAVATHFAEQYLTGTEETA